MNKYRLFTIIILLGLLAFVFQGSSSAAPVEQVQGPIAITQISDQGLLWEPAVAAAGFELNVALSGNSVAHKHILAGSKPTFTCQDEPGGQCLDGVYTYELIADPIISAEALARLQAARQDGNVKSVIQELQQAGRYPQTLPAQSGSFTAKNGVFLVSSYHDGSTRNQSFPNQNPAPNTVIAEDLIVNGNIFACPNCAGGAPYSFVFHAKTSDSPGLQLEQDGSVYPAQTWDLAGNEQNFAIIDETHLSQVVFQIKTGAPWHALFIESNGNVGLGTDTPTQRLDVIGNALVRGNLQVNGYVSELSDFNAKQNFSAVNGRQVLEQLAAVPVMAWSYKDDPTVQHMGPVAQDFYAAYGLGSDNKHIAALDVNGVTLAAVKELNQQVKEKDTRISELGAQVDGLQARLTALEARGTVGNLFGQAGPFILGLCGLGLGGFLAGRKKPKE